MSKAPLKNLAHQISRPKSKKASRRLSAIIAVILVSILASNMLQNVDSAISTQSNPSNHKVTTK